MTGSSILLLDSNSYNAGYTVGRQRELETACFSIFRKLIKELPQAP